MPHAYHEIATRDLALTIAYDGTAFAGYARQKGELPTVQGALEEALVTVVGEGFRTVVAGRTDRGVHALAQVVGLSLEEERSLDLSKVRKSLDSLTPASISVLAVKAAPEGFHARFSAVWRRYRYLISSRDADVPHLRRLCWHLGPDFRAEPLAEAAPAMLGERDFSTFCRRDPGGGSLYRRVEEVSLYSVATGVWALEIRANAFCHQMVRSLVGYLGLVAVGDKPASAFADALAAADRAKGVTLAPPEGLYLVGVGYKEPYAELGTLDVGGFRELWSYTLP
ncbi:MAG: tRNA pseudouridine(38-40) synthase TruA [Actinomycetota bacterium]|nr:tRNA pseudouridine(38-40) synthase TruA [Actinomycetota bacterium]